MISSDTPRMNTGIKMLDQPSGADLPGGDARARVRAARLQLAGLLAVAEALQACAAAARTRTRTRTDTTAKETPTP